MLSRDGIGLMWSGILTFYSRSSTYRQNDPANVSKPLDSVKVNFLALSASMGEGRLMQVHYWKRTENFSQIGE